MPTARSAAGATRITVGVAKGSAPAIPAAAREARVDPVGTVPTGAVRKGSNVEGIELLAAAHDLWLMAEIRQWKATTKGKDSHAGLYCVRAGSFFYSVKF